jgi:uncharacterized protein (TIGR03066 family)
MAVRRAVLAGCLLLAVAGAGLAQAKKATIDATKLVGVWTFVKTGSPMPPPPGSEIKVEYTKDGKLNLTMKLKDKTFKQSGTYKLDGDQLSVTLPKPGGGTATETDTIKELTDKKMVLLEKKGDKTYPTEFKK